MLNKVMLIGNLGADPDIRYMPNGDAVASLSLATTRRWKDRQSGERKEHAEWHRVVMFRKLAEIAGEYLKKGGQVYIEGRLQTRKWTDQQGVDRYTTEIVADEMQMLGRKSSGGVPHPADSGQPAPEPGPGDDFDDDIPYMRLQHVLIR